MSFTDDIRKFNKKFGDEVERVDRKIKIDISTAVVLRTPVGNPDLWKSKAQPGYAGGRARGNWQLSDKIKQKEIETVDPDGSATLTEIARNVEGTTGSECFLFNNVPYILALEYEGHSKQAPQGMVELSVLEFKRIVKESVG